MNNYMGYMGFSEKEGFNNEEVALSIINGAIKYFHREEMRMYGRKSFDPSNLSMVIRECNPRDHKHFTRIIPSVKKNSKKAWSKAVIKPESLEETISKIRSPIFEISFIDDDIGFEEYSSQHFENVDSPGFLNGPAHKGYARVFDRRNKGWDGENYSEYILSDFNIRTYERENFAYIKINNNERNKGHVVGETFNEHVPSALFGLHEDDLLILYQVRHDYFDSFVCPVVRVFELADPGKVDGKSITYYKWNVGRKMKRKKLHGTGKVKDVTSPLALSKVWEHLRDLENPSVPSRMRYDSLERIPETQLRKIVEVEKNDFKHKRGNTASGVFFIERIGAHLDRTVSKYPELDKLQPHERHWLERIGTPDRDPNRVFEKEFVKQAEPKIYQSFHQLEMFGN